MKNLKNRLGQLAPTMLEPSSVFLLLHSVAVSARLCICGKSSMNDVCHESYATTLKFIFCVYLGQPVVPKVS